MQVEEITSDPRRTQYRFPELKREIPALFNVAGIAKVVRGGSRYSWKVRVNLCQPVKVINWHKTRGDGIAINSDTNACMDKGDFSVKCLPKPGDKEITLYVPFYWDQFDRSKKFTLDDARKLYRDFAALMTKTWYYHFK